MDTSNKKLLNCSNCNENVLNLLICSVCKNGFCDSCVDFFDEKYSLIKPNDRNASVMCYECRNFGLETFNKTLKVPLETPKMTSYAFTEGTKIVEQPNFPFMRASIICGRCKIKTHTNKCICNLCADFLCGDCAVIYKGGKLVYSYPFYKKKNKRTLCHECYFNLHSGKILVGPSAVCFENRYNILYDLCLTKIAPDLNSKTKSLKCVHCAVKLKKSYCCGVCSKSFCALCKQFFSLPPQFAAFRVKTKSNMVPVCYGCRNQVLSETGHMDYLKAIHPNARIDYDKRSFNMPLWQPAPPHKFCQNCQAALNSSKATACGLCGDFYCKKCQETVEDPSEVFLNPNDIYSFNICGECRYFKISGFENNSSSNIRKMEQLINKSFSKSSHFDEKEIQTLFCEKFDLPEEIVVDYFNCFQKKSILILGKMFVTKNLICYFSNLFNKNTKIVLQINEITKISLVGLIRNEFQILVYNERKNKPQKYTFMFVSIFSAAKHLKLLEKIVKSKNVPFEKSVVFSPKRAKSSVVISSEENKSTSLSENFDSLKAVKMERLYSRTYPVNVNYLFRFAFSDEAEYSLLDFMHTEKGHSDFISSKWDKEGSIYSRSITFQLKITGIPKIMRSFSSESSVVRSEQLIRNSNSFSICVNIQMPEMTYGENFEIFNLYKAKSMGDNESVIEFLYGINFKKQIPFIQSKIANKSKEESLAAQTRFLDTLATKLGSVENVEPNLLRRGSRKSILGSDKEKTLLKRQVRTLRIGMGCLVLLWVGWIVWKRIG